MKKIIVKWVKCSEIDLKKFGYEKEMIVMYSNHERFVEGYRFDFGFLHIASEEGYIIEVLP